MKQNKHCPHEDDIRYGELTTVDGIPQYRVFCKTCGASGVIRLEEGREIWDKDDGLVRELMEYESDTFSATGSKITQLEAEQVADRLVKSWISKYLDGVSIAVLLEEFREGTEEA